MIQSLLLGDTSTPTPLQPNQDQRAETRQVFFRDKWSKRSVENETKLGLNQEKKKTRKIRERVGAAGGGVGGHGSRVCLSSDSKGLFAESMVQHSGKRCCQGDSDARWCASRDPGQPPHSLSPYSIYPCVLIGFLQILIYVSGADVILTLYKQPASELHLFSPTYQK